MLALAIGVPENTYLQRLNRIRVSVMHVGPPIEVVIVARARNTSAENWEYVDGLRYLPQRLKTSRTGRRVLVQLPEIEKQQVQLCVRYTPPKREKQFALQLSVESCSNLPRLTSGPSRKQTILKVPALS